MPPPPSFFASFQTLLPFARCLRKTLEGQIPILDTLHQGYHPTGFPLITHTRPHGGPRDHQVLGSIPNGPLLVLNRSVNSGSMRSESAVPSAPPRRPPPPPQTPTLPTRPPSSPNSDLNVPESPLDPMAPPQPQPRPSPALCLPTSHPTPRAALRDRPGEAAGGGAGPAPSLPSRPSGARRVAGEGPARSPPWS